jgi:hypothetical protein
MAGAFIRKEVVIFRGRAAPYLSFITCPVGLVDFYDRNKNSSVGFGFFLSKDNKNSVGGGVFLDKGNKKPVGGGVFRDKEENPVGEAAKI